MNYLTNQIQWLSKWVWVHNEESIQNAIKKKFRLLKQAIWNNQGVPRKSVSALSWIWKSILSLLPNSQAAHCKMSFPHPCCFPRHKPWVSHRRYLINDKCSLSFQNQTWVLQLVIVYTLLFTASLRRGKWHERIKQTVFGWALTDFFPGNCVG